MTDKGRYHGGLVFFGYKDGDLGRFTRIVAETLEDYGHPVERRGVLDRQQASITASHYHITLTMTGVMPASEHMCRARRLDRLGKLDPGRQPVSDVPARMVIDICAADPVRDDADISQLLLVVMLYRLVDHCEARAVEWLEPETVLDLAQFIAAFTELSPHILPFAYPGVQVATASPLEPAPLARQKPRLITRRPRRESTAQAGLVETFRGAPEPVAARVSNRKDDAQSNIRRLAIWGMTGMLAFLSAPVAAAMATVNLIRGEDFRMTTQVLSLTGLLVVLQSSGAIASVMSRLPM